MTIQSNQPAKTGKQERYRVETAMQQPGLGMGARKQIFSLKAKATALALAIGIIPVLITGATTYYLVNETSNQQVLREQKLRAISVSRTLTGFAEGQLKDIQTIARNSFLANARIRAQLTPEQISKLLDESLTDGRDNIAVIGLDGRVLYKSRGETPANYTKIDYFKQVLQTKKAAVNPLRKSTRTLKYSFFAAAPIFDSVTGEMVAVVRSRTPATEITKLVQSNQQFLATQLDTVPSRFWVTDAKGDIFAALDAKDINQKLESLLPKYPALEQASKLDSARDVLTSDKTEVLVTYTPLQGGGMGGDLAALKWSVVVSDPVEVAFATNRNLLVLLVAGTGLTALLVGLIAIYVSDRGTRPLLAATEAVQKLSQGDLQARVAVEGNDELSALGENINLMAVQIDSLLDSAQQTANQQAAQREALQAEVGQIGRAVEAIGSGDLTARVGELAIVEVQGLGEGINQMTDQIEALVGQSQRTAEEQRQQKEALQSQLVELLMEVEGASRGDLTVRANITAGEIGIVGDFFNAIIESLRKIVTQVKTAAGELNTSLGENEGSIRQLSIEADTQSGEVSRTLVSVQQMTRSIQEVSDSAREAASVARAASATAEAGGEAMDRTVAGILSLRETVAETSKKVKRLGESSQKISKVVSLINQIALQTNLLAINASIEAARAGEEGRGFAVVAEEVGSLAAQSAAATKEIEQIVDNIQIETSEVVGAMELGTEQVVAGTRLVEEAKQSLGEILNVSRRIDTIVQSISNATVTQASTSRSVSDLMQDIAKGSVRTSDASRLVSGALQQTVQVAQQLQQTVEAFKVADEKPRDA